MAVKSKKVLPKLKNRWTLFAAGVCGGFALQFVPLDNEFNVVESPKTALVQEDLHMPTHGISLKKHHFALNYDPHTKNAAWVYRKLQAKDFEGRADRGEFDFQEDLTIPTHLRARKKDYVNSGFDRGHLVSASSSTKNKEGMQESFLLSNIVPQLPSFNRGYWKKLENELRRMASERDVHVFVGPLYLPNVKAQDQLFVKYQVLGQSHIAVPTHFFAVIFAHLKNNKIGVKAYVLPHKVIDANISLEKFLTTLQKVEEASGIVFDNFIRSLQ